MFSMLTNNSPKEKYTHIGRGKKYLNNQEKDVWSGEIAENLPIWDPMGSLA